MSYAQVGRRGRDRRRAPLCAGIPIPLPGVLVVKAVVFGAASAALYAMGHVSWAAVAVVVAVANTALATLDRRAAMHRQA